MIKRILTIGALIVAGMLAYPYVKPYLPIPLTIERVQEAYEAEDFVITEFKKHEQPQRESAETWSMKLGDYNVEILRYNDEGKVAKHHEFLKQDPGSAMVEQMNIAQQLGAAEDPNLPSAVARKGKWICYVVGPEEGVCGTITKIFRGA